MPARKIHVESRLKAILQRDRVIKRFMLICASLALVLGVFGLCLYVNVTVEEINSSPPSSDCMFGDYCPELTPTPAPTHPPTSEQLSSRSDAYSTVGIFLGIGGYALCSLIALLVGLAHAAAHHAWRWIGYGFFSPPRLGIILILLILWLFNLSPFSGLGTLLLLLFLIVVVAFLFPIVCLIYALLLES